MSLDPHALPVLPADAEDISGTEGGCCGSGCCAGDASPAEESASAKQ